MKQAALRIVHNSGFFAPFRYFNRNKLLILMYHRFSNTPDYLSTSASDFESHLKYLKERYKVISLSDAVQQLTSSKKVVPRTAVITIDDGYRDAYDIALPLFRKHQIPATIFVVSDFLDRKVWLWTDRVRFLTLYTEAKTVEFEAGHGPLRRQLSDRLSRLKVAAEINTLLKELPDAEKELAIDRLSSTLKVQISQNPSPEFEALTWDQLLEMERYGIQAGSHTVTHPILTRINNERLRMELRDSKARLESVLGHEVSLFCYPNGATNDQVTAAVRDAGYRSAVTATPGFNGLSPDPFKLSRISAENDLPHFAQNISGFEGFKNAFRSAATTP